jgi:hypothetical protein
MRPMSSRLPDDASDDECEELRREAKAFRARTGLCQYHLERIESDGSYDTCVQELCQRLLDAIFSGPEGQGQLAELESEAALQIDEEALLGQNTGSDHEEPELDPGIEANLRRLIDGDEQSAA